jgi:hypothetical protein
MNIRNSYCPQFGHYQFKQVYVEILTVMNTNIYACSAHKISAFADVQGQASHYRTLLMWVSGHFKAVQSDP